MAKKTTMVKKTPKTTHKKKFHAPLPHPTPRMVMYTVPETVTIGRHDALVITSVIEGVIGRLRAIHPCPLLESDMRTLERATYILLGMSVPDWLDERYQDNQGDEA